MIQITSSTEQMGQIISLIGRTIKIITTQITTRTTTNKAEHTVELTTCEPGTMVGEDVTTHDDRISAVAHTKIITTMTGGTPGTKPGGVEAKKTIDGIITVSYTHLDVYKRQIIM